ncbi:MAG: response regulator [Fimbriiglobus sp.]
MPTLLIVDDEPENIELLNRRLTRRGFTVHGANSAEEALAKALSVSPDLILMDIKMPNIDGFDAMKMLQAEPKTAGIPIIALTAHAMNEDRDRALACGAKGYETKPVDLDQLLRTIRELVPETKS